MCRMINRSKVAYETSKMQLDYYKDGKGDAWLDSACFNAQQAVEFLIKGILLSNGIYFGENGLDKKQGHVIDFLLEQLEEINFTFEKLEELELLSATLTSWEQGARYGEGIRTSAKTLHRIYKIYDSMLEQFLSESEQIQKIDKNTEE